MYVCKIKNRETWALHNYASETKDNLESILNMEGISYYDKKSHRISSLCRVFKLCFKTHRDPFSFSFLNQLILLNNCVRFYASL